MSRKTILIVVIVALIGLGTWAYIQFFNQPQQAGTSGQKSLLGTLFPFGSTSSTPTSTPAGTTTSTTPGQQEPSASAVKKLTRISDKFVAGLTVLPVNTTVVPTYNINDTTGAASAAAQAIPIVRFAERGTGYVYDVTAEGKNLTKRSGTVVARTAVALFGDNGTSVLLRYIKEDNTTVASFLGHIIPPTDALSIGILKGDFLPDNISDVAMSPDKKNFVFLLPTSTGIAGLTMKTDGTTKKQIFSSAFSEWLLDWQSPSVTVTTKAAGSVPGYAYSITSTGGFQKILGDMNGLTTKMSPDGKSILYSVSVGNKATLYIRHLKDGSAISTGLSTLPEKCLWAADSTAIYCGAAPVPPQAPLPDAWYQGTTSFIDALWKIQASTGLTTEIDDGEGNEFDATNLAIDQSSHYLIFVNKNDGSLWSLDLTK